MSLFKNFFTNADKSKLDGIEASATADQTGAEIKTAYEGEDDTNEFSDAEQTKLAALDQGVAVADDVIFNTVAQSVSGNLTAGSTQTQAGATALSDKTNRITVVGTNGDGVKLPAAAVGLEILIMNDDGGQNIQIWPDTGDKIDGGSTDAADVNTLAAGGRRRYVAFSAAEWLTTDS